MMPKTRTLPAALVAVLTLAAGILPRLAAAEPSVEDGKYLVQIGGCNDCHTPGYLMNDGQTPEEHWLVGDSFGWNGPWGTTYATNLRLRLLDMSEDEWVDFARSMKTRPPMPWFTVNRMLEDDLRSIYRYVSSLGKAGDPAPSALPPGQEPPMPFVSFPAPPPAE